MLYVFHAKKSPPTPSVARPQLHPVGVEGETESEQATEEWGCPPGLRGRVHSWVVGLGSALVRGPQRAPQPVPTGHQPNTELSRQRVLV